MPEDLKLSQIGSFQLPPPFRGLHSPGVRKHCQIIFACYFRKSSILPFFVVVDWHIHMWMGLVVNSITWTYGSFLVIVTLLLYGVMRRNEWTDTKKQSSHFNLARIKFSWLCECLLTAYCGRRRVERPLKLLGLVYIFTRRTAWRKRERRLSWTQRRRFVRGSTSSRTAGRGVCAFRCTCECEQVCVCVTECGHGHVHPCVEMNCWCACEHGLLM